jgi:NADPH:quinone reductase
MNARALVCTRLDDDLGGVAPGTFEVPPPAAGEVAVAVRAAALNFPDLLMTRGGYQHKPELPFVVGMEGAGEVAAVGDGVSGYSVGDRVCFSGKEGAIAERIVLPAQLLRPVPAGFDWAQAAAFQVGAVTAWVSLVVRGGLRPGETLLVHGATGGMGAAAVQLGRHLGATVIATGSAGPKLEAVRALGADHVIAVGNGFRERVKELTGGKGADVVFDPVGGDVFDESVRCIGWDGRLLVVGFTSGRIPTVAANLALIKSFSVIGVRAGEHVRRNPAEGRAIVAEVVRLAEQGVFRPLIGARFPLARALEAMRALQSREVPGKIVVEIPGG